GSGYEVADTDLRAALRLLLLGRGVFQQLVDICAGHALAGGASHALFGYQYNPTTAPWLMLATFVIAGVLVTLTEVTFALGQWQTNQLGTELLEREQLQSQLTELKQQVNPHFLFNSLNSLSVLISEDPVQAERFVDELAQVYRYQLQATRSSHSSPLAGLVPLEAELRFLHSYTYLLQVRYGAGLEFNMPIATTIYPPGVLFPLTLQALVDNAIRHNALSASATACLSVLFRSHVHPHRLSARPAYAAPAAASAAARPSAGEGAPLDSPALHGALLLHAVGPGLCA
nr:hypothetical protein [Tanacetum cinerariifolium]